MNPVRRMLSLVPLRPLAVFCATAGAGALARDLTARAGRVFDEVLREIEENSRRWVP